MQNCLCWKIIFRRHEIRIIPILLAEEISISLSVFNSFPQSAQTRPETWDPVTSLLYNSQFPVKVKPRVTMSFLTAGKLESPHTSININNWLTDSAFQKLDFENPNERKFLLVVVATEEKTERRLSSSATITVEVEDLNDNSPVFDLDSYTQTISENSVPGNHLAVVGCEILKYFWIIDWKYSPVHVVPKSLRLVLKSLHNNGWRWDTTRHHQRSLERQIKKFSLHLACCTVRCLWL